MSTTIKIKDDIPYIEVDGPLFGAEASVGKFWIKTAALGEYCARGQATSVAQFYQLVMPGLILTKHIFSGLTRPLYCHAEMTGDASKYVFARKPAWDFVWVGGRNGEAVQKTAPENSVFVVVISKNIKHLDKFPEVSGWIERWNWVEEDPGLDEAPVNWVDRYDAKIWTGGHSDEGC